jgi:hypothetical protein
MKKSIRIIGIAMLFLLLIGGTSGCSLLGGSSDMPPTEVTFYDIKISLPYGYIIDSTQSDEYLRVYEKGFYKSLIILSIDAFEGDPAEWLDGYADYVNQSGGTAQRTTFIEYDAVYSVFTDKEGKPGREMMFIYKNYCYAVSLRGGTEQDFDDLLATVSLTDKSVEI